MSIPEDDAELDELLADVYRERKRRRRLRDGRFTVRAGAKLEGSLQGTASLRFEIGGDDVLIKVYGRDAGGDVLVATHVPHHTADGMPAPSRGVIGWGGHWFQVSVDENADGEWWAEVDHRFRWPSWFWPITMPQRRLRFVAAALTVALLGSWTFFWRFSARVVSPIGMPQQGRVTSASPPQPPGVETSVPLPQAPRVDAGASGAGVEPTVNTPYNTAMVASGGGGPYTYSIPAGSLPPGLTLDKTTGAITGTPTTAGSLGTTHLVNVRPATPAPTSPVPASSKVFATLVPGIAKGLSADDANRLVISKATDEVILNLVVEQSDDAAEYSATIEDVTGQTIQQLSGLKREARDNGYVIAVRVAGQSLSNGSYFVRLSPRRDDARTENVRDYRFLVVKAPDSLSVIDRRFIITNKTGRPLTVRIAGVVRNVGEGRSEIALQAEDTIAIVQSKCGTISQPLDPAFSSIEVQFFCGQ